MEEKSGLITLSPSDRTLLPQACTWVGQLLGAELPVVVEGGIEVTMIGEMIGITIGGGALVLTEGGVLHPITGEGILEAGAEVTPQEEGIILPGDIRRIQGEEGEGRGIDQESVELLL